MIIVLLRKKYLYIQKMHVEQDMETQVKELSTKKVK